MRRYFAVLLIASIFSLIALFAKSGQGKKAGFLTTTELGFLVKLVDEKKVTSDPYTWDAKVLISPESFTKDNLEKIFQWYTDRHPNGDGKIILTVFINEKDLEKEDRFNDKSDLPAPYNAIFFRDGSDKKGFYVYDIDPAKKDKRGTGTLPD